MRSRRSAGGGDGASGDGGGRALNPFTLDGFTIGRLREELTARGMDTAGSKMVLVDRLREAVVVEKGISNFGSMPDAPVAVKQEPVQDLTETSQAAAVPVQTRGHDSLNPYTLNGLSISRLKEELSSRGLDCTGAKHKLVDRLQEAVCTEKGMASDNVNAATTPSPKRNTSLTSKHNTPKGAEAASSSEQVVDISQEDKVEKSKQIDDNESTEQAAPVLLLSPPRASTTPNRNQKMPTLIPKTKSPRKIKTPKQSRTAASEELAVETPAVAVPVSEKPKTPKTKPSNPPVCPEPKAKTSEPPVSSEMKAKTSEPPVRSEPKAKTSEPPVSSEPKAKTSEPPVSSEPKAKTSEPPVSSEPKAKTSEPPVSSEPKAKKQKVTETAVGEANDTDDDVKPLIVHKVKVKHKEQPGSSRKRQSTDSHMPSTHSHSHEKKKKHKHKERHALNTPHEKTHKKTSLCIQPSPASTPPLPVLTNQTLTGSQAPTQAVVMQQKRESSTSADEQSVVSTGTDSSHTNANTAPTTTATRTEPVRPVLKPKAKPKPRVIQASSSIDDVFSSISALGKTPVAAPARPTIYSKRPAMPAPPIRIIALPSDDRRKNPPLRKATKVIKGEPITLDDSIESVHNEEDVPPPPPPRISKPAASTATIVKEEPTETPLSDTSPAFEPISADTSIDVLDRQQSTEGSAPVPQSRPSTSSAVQQIIEKVKDLLPALIQKQKEHQAASSSSNQPTVEQIKIDHDLVDVSASDSSVDSPLVSARAVSEAVTAPEGTIGTVGGNQLPSTPATATTNNQFRFNTEQLQSLVNSVQAAQQQNALTSASLHAPPVAPVLQAPALAVEAEPVPPAAPVIRQIAATEADLEEPEVKEEGSDDYEILEMHTIRVGDTDTPDFETEAAKAIIQALSANRDKQPADGNNNDKPRDSRKRGRQSAADALDEDEDLDKEPDYFPVNESEAQIDFFHSDLHLKQISASKYQAEPESKDGFGLMWCGAKATHGITTGKVAFHVKILEKLGHNIPFEEAGSCGHYDLRVGWSARKHMNPPLGEAAYSYAASASAKKASNNQFTDYGQYFEKGDVVTCCLDLAQGCITYYLNGQSLGVAFDNVPAVLPLKQEPDAAQMAHEEQEQYSVHTIDGKQLVWYPHVATRNYRFEINFGQQGEWQSLPEGHVMLNELPSSDRVLHERQLADKYVVLCMVGLPGVGKSTWVREYLREHPSEQWMLLSADATMDMMRYNGQSRLKVHTSRWDVVMGMVAKVVNRTINLACRRKRNYIIDQTNTAIHARRRKLMPFRDFRRVCAVIVPSDDQFRQRCHRQEQETGMSMPPEAMLELKGLFALPSTEYEPYIDLIQCIEPTEDFFDEARFLVDQYNQEGRPWYSHKHGYRFGFGGENFGGVTTKGGGRAHKNSRMIKAQPVEQDDDTQAQDQSLVPCPVVLSELVSTDTDVAAQTGDTSAAQTEDTSAAQTEDTSAAGDTSTVAEGQAPVDTIQPPSISTVVQDSASTDLPAAPSTSACTASTPTDTEQTVTAHTDTSTQPTTTESVSSTNTNTSSTLAPTAAPVPVSDGWAKTAVGFSSAPATSRWKQHKAQAAAVAAAANSRNKQ